MLASFKQLPQFLDPGQRCGSARLSLYLGARRVIGDSALGVQDLHQNDPQVSQQILDPAERTATAVERLSKFRVDRQPANQDAQPASRQSAAIEVDQVDVVLALKVGLYLVAVLFEQAIEAA